MGRRLYESNNLVIAERNFNSDRCEETGLGWLGALAMWLSAVSSVVYLFSSNGIRNYFFIDLVNYVGKVIKILGG